MCTTLTIDDDLAAIIQREAKRKGMSFKGVVNAALRRGLTSEDILPPPKKVEIRPHSFGFKPGIDLTQLNRFADELEAEDFAAKFRQQP